MSAPMSDVLNIARTYLNDDNATQFPDPVLIPKIQEAHRELQEELWIVGSPLVRAQNTPGNPILVPIGTLQLVIGATAYNLPSDLLCPTAMYEAPDPIGSGVWSPVTEVFFLPLQLTPTTKLEKWCWQQEMVWLTPATTDRQVMLQYRRSIPIPQISTDPVGILFGESYLAARAAAMAAGTLGNAEVHTALTALAKENLGKVIAANRGQQKPMMRP